MTQVRFDIPVEEFTTPNPITAPVDMHVDDLIALMEKHGVRHLPITADDEIVGILSDRDLRLAKGLNKAERNQITASDIMAADPVTVSAGETLDEVAYTMAREKIGSVLVHDENDKLLGIFTVTDALNALVEIVRGDGTAQ